MDDKIATVSLIIGGTTVKIDVPAGESVAFLKEQNEIVGLTYLNGLPLTREEERKTVIADGDKVRAVPQAQRLGC